VIPCITVGFYAKTNSDRPGKAAAAATGAKFFLKKNQRVQTDHPLKKSSTSKMHSSTTKRSTGCMFCESTAAD